MFVSNIPVEMMRQAMKCAGLIPSPNSGNERWMLRKDALRMIYRWTPSDYKGRAGDMWREEDRGKPTVLVFQNGTCLILLEDMSDEDIAARLPRAMRLDAQAKAKRAAAKEAAKVAA